MNHLRHQLFLILGLLLGGISAYAQPKGAENEAWQLATQGHELISKGEFQEAVQKFTYACKLVPENVDFQLGLANAWFFAAEYEKAKALCKPLMSGRRARAEAYEVYGNCQDATGETYEALATYRKGLHRFPNAGILWMEMGIVEAARGDKATALSYWEQGIMAQPTLPSNYFFAAQTLHEAGAYSWAIIYAELFINLERTGERVRDMSRLLMRSYERARHYDYQKAYQWQFFQVKDPLLKLQPTSLDTALNQAFAAEFKDTASAISIARILDMRRFVCLLLPQQLPNDPSRGLWDWQQLLIQNGHFTPYNYWLFYDARDAEFMEWFESGRPDYEGFEGWILLNTFYRHIKRPVLRVAVAEKQKR